MRGVINVSISCCKNGKIVVGEIDSTNARERNSPVLSGL